MRPDSTPDSDRRWVMRDDARWLADHLRKVVSSRPAAWASSELTLAQLLALHVISAQAPITLIALSEVLGTRPPATSAMVDRLARAGLVRRTPDSDDRRRVLLVVTSHAVTMIGKVDVETARRLQVVLNSMGAAAQRCLTEVIKDTARRLTV
jgi:MarR family transcriptional regulator, organic hydroperoxide resistance regulator